MTDLELFAGDLEKLIGRPSSLRPFVCEGSPLTCTAFIVGFNAATDLGTDFWTHWDPSSGFSKDAWFSEYLGIRAGRPLKPGRTRRQPLSTTRKRTNLIVEAARPIRCLETNIYPKPSASASELERHDRSTAVFDFLLTTIKPQVILVHGQEAVAYLRRRGGSAHLIESPHLASRAGFNDSAASALGTMIANALQASNG